MRVGDGTPAAGGLWRLMVGGTFLRADVRQKLGEDWCRSAAALCAGGVRAVLPNSWKQMDFPKPAVGPGLSDPEQLMLS